MNPDKMIADQKEYRHLHPPRVPKIPLAVRARDYAETTADLIYLRVWPIDAAAFESALARAFEAGWRARG